MSLRIICPQNTLKKPEVDINDELMFLKKRRDNEILGSSSAPEKASGSIWCRFPDVGAARFHIICISCAF